MSAPINVPERSQPSPRRLASFAFTFIGFAVTGVTGSMTSSEASVSPCATRRTQQATEPSDEAECLNSDAARELLLHCTMHSRIQVAVLLAIVASVVGACGTSADDGARTEDGGRADSATAGDAGACKGPPLTLAEFDTTCNGPADCEAVFIGDQCKANALGCADFAINRGAIDAWRAALRERNAPPQSGLCAPAHVGCVGGRCCSSDCGAVDAGAGDATTD